jgi:hypothetical protein
MSGPNPVFRIRLSGISRALAAWFPNPTVRAESRFPNPTVPFSESRFSSRFSNPVFRIRLSVGRFKIPFWNPVFRIRLSRPNQSNCPGRFRRRIKTRNRRVTHAQTDYVNLYIRLGIEYLVHRLHNIPCTCLYIKPTMVYTCWVNSCYYSSLPLK